MASRHTAVSWLRANHLLSECTLHQLSSVPLTGPKRAVCQGVSSQKHRVNEATLDIMGQTHTYCVYMDIMDVVSNCDRVYQRLD